MIEKTILDYLTASLSVPVYMERPEVNPESYVVIEKTGSGRYDRIETATLAIQSYACSMYEAATLNEAVKAAMDEAVNLDSIARVLLNSDYNYTDTASKSYRYQAVFDVTFY